MILLIQIGDAEQQIVNARSLTVDFDANILRIHLDDEANEYITQELSSVGFSEQGIAIIISQTGEI